MEKLEIFLAIGLGGALGAVARYVLSNLITVLTDAAFPFFPYGTWVVNALGCLTIGVIFTLGLETTWITPTGRAFLITGFLGAFTTFSTFANEALLLFQEGKIATALLYILSSNLVGLGFVALGHLLVLSWLRG